MVCGACGSELETVERQLRAADEATQKVTSCPKCPVKVWKIDTITKPQPSVRGFRFPVVRPGGPSHTPVVRTRSRRYEIVITSLPERYGTITPMHRRVVVQKGVSHVSLDKGSFVPIRTTVPITGPGIGECSAPHERRILGFGITLVSYVVYDDVRVDSSDTRTLTGYYEHVASILGCETVVHKHRGSEVLTLVVRLDEEPTDATLRLLIDNIHSLGALPKVIAPYIDNDFTSKLGTLSSRAWDASKAPDSGYVFTCKPDGERSWLVFYGWCWYMVSKQKPHRVKKWQVSGNKVVGELPSLFLDTEYVSGFGFILIDCLTDSGGFAAPTARDIKWVLTTYNEILNVHTQCPVNVREYFNTFGDAQTYTKNIRYPVDGIIAIRNGSTEVLKIKEIKSVELEHKGGGVMCTAEGTEVLRIDPTTDIAKDVVVELRFSLDPDSKEYKLWDMFPRSDKNGAPNNFIAVSNIFRSANAVETRDDDERRRSLLWCNRLREIISAKCVEAADSRHIILDVGTGTGQSLGTMSKSESVSYVLLEPDSKRCKSLQHRLGGAQIVSDPSHIIPLVRQLKTRSKKWLIVNCTLSALCSSPGVLKKLAPELKCIQATFSLQFIVDDLYDVLESYKIPIYGCCYTYDDIDQNGVLVDACGVSMKVTGANTASVMWGRDKRYEEPVVNVGDLYGLGSVIRGFDIIEMPDESAGIGCRSICSKVSVLLP